MGFLVRRRRKCFPSINFLSWAQVSVSVHNLPGAFPLRPAWLGIKAANSWQDFPARSGEKLGSREGKIGLKIVPISVSI
jgi:hypothetical protein